jgi:N-acetylneuraminic acid mutarotase
MSQAPLKGKTSLPGYSLSKPATWEILPPFPGSAREGAILLRSFDNRLYLFGGYLNGNPVLSTWEYSLKFGWVEKTVVPSWLGKPSAVAFGESHLLLFGATDHHGVLAYHTITDTWVEMGLWPDAPDGDPAVILKGNRIYTLSGAEARMIQVSPLKTKYGWIDHSVVILYLLGMVAVGVYFNSQKRTPRTISRGAERYLGGRPA